MAVELVWGQTVITMLHLSFYKNYSTTDSLFEGSFSLLNGINVGKVTKLALKIHFFFARNNFLVRFLMKSAFSLQDFNNNKSFLIKWLSLFYFLLSKV